MPGLLGVFTADSVPVDIERLIETINLGGRSLVQSWQLPDGFMAVAALRETPLKGPRYYQDDRYLACFTGDLIGAEEIPWASIISAFMSEAYSDLAHLKGTFGIAVFDKSTRCIILVSDRKAQVPLCYSIDEKGVVFSTSMATFCRLPAARPFNVEFLYETMFFNFPIGETTFLTGVKRLTPGSVLTVDLASREVTPHRYVSRFRRAETVLVGDRALERARSVLERRVAEHFGSGFGVALGLSGGADSRLIMSLCPSSVRDSVYAYTFGIRGCRDLQEGARVAKALRVKHRAIHLDDTFLAELPGLMRESVYLGAGRSSVLRSPLLYAHSMLASSGLSYPVALSGTCMNQVFRGRFPVPMGVSAGMARAFRAGRPVVDDALYSRVFCGRSDGFVAHILTALHRLQDAYGDLGSGECHLSYHVYEYGPKYCGAEMALVNEFATLRAPAWDDDIISLAYEIEFSTLCMSSFAVKGIGSQEEYGLYADILSRNPDAAAIPLKGFPIRVLKGPRIPFVAHRLLRAAQLRSSRLLKRKQIRSADWRRWLTSGFKPTVEDIVLSDDSLVTGYLDRSYIAEQLRARSSYWLGKILTLEFLLRAIGCGWRRLDS